MLRAEDNKFLTESGAGTGMGELLRRFWIPVLLSAELPEPTAPERRSSSWARNCSPSATAAASVGVIDQYCPHRGANLWLGRNEECGIRCVYHGWKFDTDGAASTCRPPIPTSTPRT
jgi:phenylpropionate dioxygenase-like ring-hydroxylating dioxygenase large terminal subunit